MSINKETTRSVTDASVPAPTRRFDLRLFTALTVLGGVGILGYVPSLAVYGLPLAALVAVAGFVLVAAAVGVALAPRVGLGLPFVERVLAGDPVGDAADRLARSFGLGVVVGCLIYAYQRFVLNPVYAAELGVDVAGAEQASPLWAQLVGAPLFGGFTEEIVFRFGLMTLVVWLAAHAWRTADGRPAPTAYWMGVIGAAGAFAAYHLVPLSGMGALTPLAVAITLVSAGANGTLLGWLYWRRGLEASMVVHLTVNLLALVVLPSLL